MDKYMGIIMNICSFEFISDLNKWLSSQWNSLARDMEETENFSFSELFPYRNFNPKF